MPRLIIDNREIEVPRGTKVIEAAEALGIIIPRFCFHPALGSLGACRMCAVKFLSGPVKGVEMSCMMEAAEGMVVSTTDAEAADFRRQVIEWLMMNHPHDCPVCDEGGHCLLQDLTVAGGQGIRRFLGKKRTYDDQNLGPFIQQEMNRCIHCFRCRRFYQEFAGYRDFGALRIARHMYFGRFSAGPLESPFSGNIIDLCPTGVLTDKPSRYKGRRWEFQRSPSLCLHCSLGCRVVASARYRELVRLEARFSRRVNGYFICDRGRYGFAYANHPERPRRARIGREEVPLDQALRAAADRLSKITRTGGPRAVTGQGSGRSSLETQGMLKRLSRSQGWPDPAYLVDPFRENTVKTAVSRLDGRVAVSLREIEQSDFILVIGADPVQEAPLLSLALRQAFRKGASIAVLDPRPVFLPLTFEHLPVTPDDLDLCLAVLIRGAVTRPVVEKTGAGALRFYEALPDETIPDAALRDRLEEITRKIKQSRRPVIVCGSQVVRETTPALAFELVLLLQAGGQPAGLFYLLGEANEFGAALLSSPGTSFLKTLEAIEKGSVAALILVECDPYRLFPDRARLEQALGKLDFLLVMDFLPSPSAQRADIFLPTQTLFEAGGSFVNQEGRVQWAEPVYRGGTPVEQLNAGGHPPRIFREDIPGGEPRPAGWILAELARLLSPGRDLSPKTLWSALAEENPIFSRLQNPKDSQDEIRLIPDQGHDPGEGGPVPMAGAGVPEKNTGPGDSLELLLVDRTFGTEEMSSYSSSLRETVSHPSLILPAEVGGRLGFRNRDTAVISLDGGPLEIALDLQEHLASGIMVLPRQDQLAWQKIAAYPVRVSLDQIKKSQETP